MTVNELRKMAALTKQISMYASVIVSGKSNEYNIDLAEKTRIVTELKTLRSEVDSLNIKLQAITSLSDLTLD